MDIVKISKKNEKFGIKFFNKEEGMGMRDAYIPIYLANAEASQISLVKASHKDISTFLF